MRLSARCSPPQRSPPSCWPAAAPDRRPSRDRHANRRAARRPFRSTGAHAGEVGFRHKFGEGRRLPPQTGPYAVEVCEGTLYFKVTQDRSGRDLLLGDGFVDGSASTRPGDLGTLRFRQPASTGPGQRVRFTLTPTGNETGPYGKVLGEDRDPSDGFRLVWNYANQALSAHLGIHATGPGGTAETS